MLDQKHTTVFHVKYGILNFVTIYKIWTKLAQDVRGSVGRISEYQDTRRLAIGLLTDLLVG